MADSIIKSKIETIEVSPPSSINVANNQWVNAGSVTMDEGIWLVLFGGAFASNATGHRDITFSTTPSAGRFSPTSAAVNGEQTRMSGSMTIHIITETTYSLYARQNSGGALQFYPYIQVVKLV